ncbi:MAG: non-ribosomal peptide synthetase [Gammaproteobacteria bacterium]|nr:non-ribosomal peptide synthetase [Gammaproteobacteria bacterium]
MPQHQTLQAVLSDDPREDREIVFVDADDNQRSISFALLQRRALTVLGALQRCGLGAGDTVILFVADNERFLEIFWACVLGAIVPVPLAAGSGEEHRRKLFRVFAQFDRAWVCSDARTLEKLDGFAVNHGFGESWSRLQQRLLPSGGLDISGEPGRTTEVTPDDIAFIQFSSGSTSEPKGVVLSHDNVCANIGSIREAAAFTDRDIALSWMPLSHDMGLIGFHLNMLACGVSHLIMRTDLFARRPLLWLELASRRRATVLCSPNFGYQHYLKQYEAKRPTGLDLSAVRLIFNGAEPISAELCQRFVETLAPHGLSPHSMFTVYGLAEASLAVSFPRPGAATEVLYLDRSRLKIGDDATAVEASHVHAAAFVKLGRAVPGTQLRVVDDAGRACAARAPGHVQIRGANVTAGYHGDEAASASARAADGWLDTGDIGLIDEGQLVITGRAKDIIFVGGQNYYPHDLERIAESVPGIETNKVAAVGVRRGDAEALVLFVLHRAPAAGLVPTALALRRAINLQTGLEVAQVLPVTRMPKTTSGKLQRYALARAFERGEFDAAMAELEPLMAVGSGAADPEIEDPANSACLQNLLTICAQVIPDRDITADTNLLEINLSSLSLARLHEAIDLAYPQRVEVVDLFDHPSLRALARFLDASG